jgi:hypothetical protein
MGSSPIAELLLVYSSTTLVQRDDKVVMQNLEKNGSEVAQSGVLMGSCHGTVPQTETDHGSPPCPSLVARRCRLPLAVIRAPWPAGKHRPVKIFTAVSWTPLR